MFPMLQGGSDMWYICIQVSVSLSLPLLQAHSIALSQSPGGLEGAQIAHSLALAYSSTSEPHHNGNRMHSQ